MPDKAAEIAEVLLARDGVDPLGDKADMTRALMKRFPGVTPEEIIRGYEIARELSAVDSQIAMPDTQVQAFFRDPPLAWRASERDRRWLAEQKRAYRVRSAMENELWALGEHRPLNTTVLTIIRAADGAAMVFAARDPEPIITATDATLAKHFDREIEAGIETAARGPG